MPKYQAEESHVYVVREALAAQSFAHLRVRRRGDLVIIESGPKHEPIGHARFRRVTVHLWCMEMATHTGRWQPTPLRDQLQRLVEMLINNFGWVLTPVD
jgi:hypothetical protein